MYKRKMRVTNQNYCFGEARSKIQLDRLAIFSVCLYIMFVLSKCGFYRFVIARHKDELVQTNNDVCLSRGYEFYFHFKTRVFIKTCIPYFAY